jgi:hypothetical protein
MRVRLRQRAASSAGVFPAGSIVDFPPDVAAELLKSGQADAVEGEAAPELAVEHVAVEQAVPATPKAGKKRGAA